MAFNVTGAVKPKGGYSEILKYPAGDDALKSVVLDASTVASGASGELILVAGTLLTKNDDDKYERYTGVSGQVVAGVLGYDVEFYDNEQQSDAPAMAFFHGAVFRVDRIVDYDDYGADAEAELFTCRFEEVNQLDG